MTTLRKHIKVPLYFQRLTIIQTDDFETIEEAYKLEEAPSKYEAMVFPWKGDIVAVFNSNVTPSIIAHEAVHICNMVFWNVGVKKDLLNDEPEAYLVGWLVDQIHKIVKI